MIPDFRRFSQNIVLRSLGEYSRTPDWNELNQLFLQELRN